ncbi:MAG: sulfotransferase family 2 domain-containing protein [Pseudomonadota bacterium]
MHNLEVVAVHIPKTAGSALIGILVRVYGRGAVLIYGRDTPLTDGPLPLDWIKPQIRALVGHFRFDQVRHLENGGGVSFVSFLRDPIERCISNFYHFKSEKEDFSRLQRLRRYEPLLLHMMLPRYRNVMSRYLAGSTESDFFRLGTAETFEDDVIELGTALGWRTAEDDSQGIYGQSERVNENTRYPQELRSVSRSTRKLLGWLNAEDVRLFRKVSATRHTGTPGSHNEEAES